jgi:hypothetical protein
MLLIVDNAADGLEYFSLQVLRAATSNFSIENKLGEGGYGEVFKVRMSLLNLCNRSGVFSIQIHASSSKLI